MTKLSSVTTRLYAYRMVKTVFIDIATSDLFGKTSSAFHEETNIDTLMAIKERLLSTKEQTLKHRVGQTESLIAKSLEIDEKTLTQFFSQVYDDVIEDVDSKIEKLRSAKTRKKKRRS